MNHFLMSRKEKISYQKLKMTDILFLLFPLVLYQPHYIVIYLSILAAFGLFFLLENKKKEEIKLFKKFYNLSIIYIFIILFSLFFPNNNIHEIFTIPGIYVVMISPLLIIYFYNLEVDFSKFFILFKIIFFLFSLLIIYLNDFNFTLRHRVFWPVNLFLLFLFFSWFFEKKNSHINFFINILFNLIFTYMVFLSGYRSLLIAYFSIILFYFIYSKFYLRDKSEYLFSISLIIIFIIILLIQNNLNTRFIEIFNNLSYFSSYHFESENFHNIYIYNNSVNIRLEFIITGFLNFISNPIFGSGLLSTDDILRDAFISLENSDALFAGHFHNTYITILSEQGLFGFIPSVIIFFYLPIIFFKSYFLKEKTFKYSFFAFAIILFYFIYGFFDTTIWVGNHYELSLYLVFIFFCYAKIIKIENILVK